MGNKEIKHAVKKKTYKRDKETIEQFKDQYKDLIDNSSPLESKYDRKKKYYLNDIKTFIDYMLHGVLINGERIQHYGNVCDFAALVGVSNWTIYKMLKRIPAFKKAHEHQKEVWIDYAESKLQQKIAEGDTNAITFFLKTQGKRRGYTSDNNYFITENKTIETIKIVEIRNNIISEDPKDNEE